MTLSEFTKGNYRRSLNHSSQSQWWRSAQSGRPLGRSPQPIRRCLSRYLDRTLSCFGPQQAEFDQSMKEVLFDFDTHETATDGAALCSNVQWLKDHPQARLFIEGYTDYPGGVVYNLALAQRRAETAGATLLDRGISADQIILTVGWGKLSPPCIEQTEGCWERSRRVRFVYAPIY